MATTVQTFTNASGTLQPFSSSATKFIDNFSSSDLVAGYTDPYQGIAFRKIESVQMTVGGTSGTANAARMGIWKSANTIFDYASVTLNGVSATVSSATASVTATVNAVIANGVTYYAGAWGSASLATRRDSNTGSFSSYTGNSTSATVGSTYNPGNLNFVLKYYYLPNGPAAPTITSKTSHSVTIAWTAPTDPGGYAATTLRYKVKWTDASGGSGTWTEETAVNALSATITGLNPGETYQFYVAAMNGVIPATGSSYSSTDGSVYIDWYSSGPWSTASTATKLNGGIYDATTSTWKPLKSGSKQVMLLGSGSFSESYVYPSDVYAWIYINNLSSLPFGVGDTLTISSSYLFGTYYIETISGSAYGWYIFFYSNYFDTTGVGQYLGAGTINSVRRQATIKAYDGSSWVTIV